MTSTDSNRAIEILPEHIIDQIKAGEVLERPASLIKELIENSLDAGSTEINIHLIENGMDLLSIEDNGFGMNFKNLPYAFVRHATSKLRSFEDLYALKSFGFRGEALASVAASSRLTCTTQPHDLNQEGGKIVISGGDTQLLIAQKSSSCGTSLFVKDLFYNTPARLKFVKSKVSEKAAIKKMISSFVLCNPHVSFSVKWDEREKEKEREIFKAVATAEHHIRVNQLFFGKRLDLALYQGVEEYDGYKVRIFFTPDTYTTPQYRHHYLFANKRFFQDKSLHSAVLRNLDSLWRFGESGHYFVDITTPPSEIDVNVHPNKTQIKFMRSDVVYSLLVTVIKNALKANIVPVQKESDAPALGFFNRDQNQSFDLMNFVERNDKSNESQHEIFTKLTAKYIIDQSSRPLKLIDCKKMLSLLIAHKFIEVETLQEVATPLLISEPFNIKEKKDQGFKASKDCKNSIDEQFEFLKSIGLEFDRLNPEFIVLRTIPRFMPQSWIIVVTQCLIDFSLSKKLFTIEHLSIFLEEKCNESILEDIPPSFVTYMLEGPYRSLFVRTLSDELLKTLFLTNHE